MMKSQNSAIGRSHVVWLDVVRFVAMFTVVCCHSTDPFNFYPGEPPANIDQIKFWGAAYGSFLRPCVPLFVMITGALLLPVKGDLRSSMENEETASEENDIDNIE